MDSTGRAASRILSAAHGPRASGR